MKNLPQYDVNFQILKKKCIIFIQLREVPDLLVQEIPGIKYKT